MKFTLSWLKEHLDTHASVHEIVDALVKLGLEVESVHNPADQIRDIVVAKVTNTSQHPNADRLRVCSVDDGSGSLLQIVCGAQNVRPNMTVALACVGAYVPAMGQKLKKGTIRDVESNGMLCSATELDLTYTNADQSDGIMDLQTDAPAGTPLAQALGLDDSVIDISITPNRGDCFSIRGIARDLSAAGLGILKPLSAFNFTESTINSINVQIDDQKSCPHYTGRLIKGVRNGPSPQWLQNRLKAIGLRPISVLVDITNYVTYDLGRPTHVFDANKLKGSLVVRSAKDGEKLKALNEINYDLDSSMMVISDDKGPIALGGIIGGFDSGCDENTLDVFVESALFDPITTATTGRKLNIHTDSRARFERGVDHGLIAYGLDFVTNMILELASTPQTTVCEKINVHATQLPKQPIMLNGSAYTKLTGLDFDSTRAAKILKDLGCEIIESKNDFLSVYAPSWRHDINLSVDLIEEILRITGYDHLKNTPLDNLKKTNTSPFDHKLKLKKKLATLGLHETITWSFMDEQKVLTSSDEKLKLSNPISQDLNTMRTNLVANLLQATARNQARAIDDISLFEMGPQFSWEKDSFKQQEMVCVLRAGNTPLTWFSKPRPVDVYDVKADFISISEHFGINIESLQLKTPAPDYYHPGRSAIVLLGNKVLGYFGQIHPSILDKFDCKGPIAICEVNLDQFPPIKPKSDAKKALHLSNYQPVERDFAFVIHDSLAIDGFIKAIANLDKHIITKVAVFDVYKGQHLNQDQKSIAIRVRIEPHTQTLTEQELTNLSTNIIQTIEKLGGELRQI